MISESKNRHISFAIDSALNNQTKFMNSKHGAVIIKNGKYICGAANTESLHAEMNALKQAQLKGSQNEKFNTSCNKNQFKV